MCVAILLRGFNELLREFGEKERALLPEPNPNLPIREEYGDLTESEKLRAEYFLQQKLAELDKSSVGLEEVFNGCAYKIPADGMWKRAKKTERRIPEAAVVGAEPPKELSNRDSESIMYASRGFGRLPASKMRRFIMARRLKYISDHDEKSDMVHITEIPQIIANLPRNEKT